jgi:hypothetical protein
LFDGGFVAGHVFDDDAVGVLRIHEASQDLATFGFHDVGSEAFADFKTRGEHVVEPEVGIRAVIAGELGADGSAFAEELVANGAAGGEL